MRVKFKNEYVELLGNTTALDQNAKDVVLVNSSLEEVKLSDLWDKTIIISIFPSIDTGVCAMQTTRFNQEVANLNNDNLILLNISLDLPFALERFCSSKGIKNAISLSDYRYKDFGMNYGYVMDKINLLARGVIVIHDKKVKYVEYVENVSNEPNYDKVMTIVKELI